jgi:Domain of unknown function (DUF4062)
MKMPDFSPVQVNTVFISSTARDLRDFRQLITHLQKDRFGVVESFPESEWNSNSTTEDIVNECRRRVFSADAAILILGPWGGWIPPGYTESITHFEFRWARQRFARLYDAIEDAAKQDYLRRTLRGFPRILVLSLLEEAALARGEPVRPTRAGLELEKQTKSLFKGLTNSELERMRISLQALHSEVREAIDAHEALYERPNNMEDMGVHIIKVTENWKIEGERLLSEMSR